MINENNKFQIDIDNLFKQNVNDLSSIKELYRKLEEIEKKITQIKYIDNTLAKKLQKEYEKLEKIILDENIQVKLANDIKTINSQLEHVENESSIKNRKIDYLFSATPWQLSYDGGVHPSRPEQITNQLEKMKYLGFDGIVVIATLVKDDNNNIDFDIPLSSILYYITDFS